MYLENRTAVTKYGSIRGVPAGNPGYTLFKGVPFAKAARWAIPVEPEPWEGVRSADSFAPAAVQAPGRNKGQGLYHKEFKPAAVDESEDCLYLNIWTPCIDEGAKMPVMLWIHGGGYVNGYSYEMEFDGEEFCKRSVVLVTVPYRLGALGFFAHPGLSAASETGTSGNYAVMDVIMALKFVRENISHFGGDPDNITVFGQSAGGGMTSALCAIPETKGLFRRAIVQSSGDATMTLGAGYTLKEAEEQGVELLKLAGLSLSEIMDMPGIEANTALLNASSMLGAGLPFSPVVDGVLVPESQGEAFTLGHNHDIDYMTGSVAGDAELFGAMGAPKVPVYWAKNQLRMGKKPIYLYYFDRMMPGDDAGAFHSSELWYMFGTLPRCWRTLESGITAGDYMLSVRMLDYWTNFAKTGDPSKGGREVPEWRPYTEGNHEVMRFNETLPGPLCAEELLSV